MVPDTTLNSPVDGSPKTGWWFGLWPVCYRGCLFPACMPLTSAVPLDTGCYEEACFEEGR